METTDENVSVELDLWASRVEDAHRRIQPMVLRTETRAGMGVVPDFQGKLSRITALTRREAEAGVVTSSMGNHGVAVAWAGLEAGVPVEVFVSTHVTADRVARMEALEARVHLVGVSVLEAEMAARAAAESGDRVYVSPYNDPWVVAGQGTIGLELLEDLPDLDAVFVAVGGGGLVGGVGAWLRARLHECLSAGRIIDVPERRTLSESTAGGIEEGSITFELARRVVDHRVLVSEEEILDAMRRLHASEGSEVEGAAGVALAAFLKERSSYQGRHVAVVLCGANLSPWVRARLADR
jgi:threonine dehydratase